MGGVNFAYLIENYSNRKNNNMKYSSKLIAAVALSLVAGQALAGKIAVVGGNSATQITNFLNSNGHTATHYNGASIVDYTDLDAVVLLRTNGDSNMATFVEDGGLLVTEWNATWALNTANLLTPTDTGHPPYRPNDPVLITNDGIAAGLAAGMDNPFLDGGQTQHYRGLSGIGSDVEVLMQWSSDNTAVAIGGGYGDGSVLINTLDWADGFGGQGSGQAEQMLLNMLNYSYSAAVPAPASIALFGLGLLLLGRTRR